jgi:hypothetical protein
MGGLAVRAPERDTSAAQPPLVATIRNGRRTGLPPSRTAHVGMASKDKGLGLVRVSVSRSRLIVDVGRGRNGVDVTKQRKSKQVARALSQEAGISYTAARRAVAGGGSTNGDGGANGNGGATGGGSSWDDYEPMSVTALLGSRLQGACDQLIGAAICPHADDRSSGISIAFDLPSDMSEPTVHEFEINETSVVVNVDEEFEGGTLGCNVTSEATLTVEALMAKADAYASADVGLVRLFEEDFNDHYASVHFDIEVEMTFLAIANPEYESVEDLTFDGAISLRS